MVKWRDVVPPEMVVVVLEELRSILLEENQDVVVSLGEVVELINQCLRGELQ